MSLGTRIVALRKQRGWTQASLARIAKMSASAIAMYETDRRTPDESSVAKLAAAFELSPAELANTTNALDTVAAAAEAAATPPSFANSLVSDQGLVSDHGFASAQDLVSDGGTPFSLTPEEARIILFVRMNPQALPFLETYMTAGSQRRLQLEKTWRLINEFKSKH